MRYRIKVHERLLVVEDTLPKRTQERPNLDHESPANKKALQGISARARSRLIRFLATIGRTDDCYFVTLTYWRWNDNFAEWKRDLDAFLKALRRWADGACGVWRLESQKRGAPHYHLLLWFDSAPDIGAFRAFVSEAWLRIINQDSPETRAHATQVDPVHEMRRSAFYLSVYQTKDQNDRKDIQTGRLWGIINRDGLQTEPFREVSFDDSQLLLLRRLVRRLYRATHRKKFRRSLYYRNLCSRYTGFSSFGEIPHWYRVLQYVQRERSTELMRTPSEVVVA